MQINTAGRSGNCGVISPRGINFTTPGASAAVLQHVTPLAGLDGDGIPGNLGEIDTINPTGGSSTTELGTGAQGRSLMATNTWRPRRPRRLEQCFAYYVGVLASSKPALVPDLMAYMISIIRASQEFEGSAWTVYDDAYRRQSSHSQRPIAMVTSEPLLIHHLLYGKGQTSTEHLKKYDG